MSKNYTQKTAALKATDADIRSLRIKHNGPKAVNGLSNILDVIPSVTDGNTNTEYGIAPEIKFTGEYIQTVPTHDDKGRLTEVNIKVGDHFTSTTLLPNGWNTGAYQLYSDKVYSTSGEIIYNISTKLIIDGTDMFNGVTSLKKFSSNLDNLAIGLRMFQGSGITEFTRPVKNLYKGDSMFKGATDLVRFNGEFDKLNTAVSMFENTTSLTSFRSNMPKLYRGNRMFMGSGLEDFSSTTPYLYDGTDMFANTNLSTINVSLKSLADGTGMFANTKLSLDSVMNIAETLPSINYTALYTDEDLVVGSENGKEIYASVPYYVYERGSYFYYIDGVWDTEIGGVKNEYKTFIIKPDTIGEIMITWQNTDIFDDDEKIIILNEYFKLMTLKGWTVITNLYYDVEGDEPNGVYARAIKVDDATTATHKKGGNFYKLYSAPNVIYPTTGFAKRAWAKYDSESAAASALGLTAL